MKTILVIEDELSLNQAIKMKLEKKGFSVLFVSSAEEAISVAEKEKDKIDFIWLDILLPGMNGLEFLKWLRNHNELKDKKVAVVSVSGGLNMKEKTKQLGAVDYIVKSEYKLDDIVARIAEKINGGKEN